MTEQTFLELDSRKRASLASLAKHDRYLVHVEEDGTIIMVPAIVMPVGTSKEIDAFLANPKTGKTFKRKER